MQAEVVRFLADRYDAANGADRRQHLPDFGDRHSQFSGRHCGEFIENLHAEHAATGKRRLGSVGLGVVRRKQIQKDVRVDESVAALHRRVSARSPPYGRT